MYGFLDKNDKMHKENLKKAKAEGIEEGKAIGKAEGIEIGIAEGIAEERINSGSRIISLVMAAKNCSLEEAIEMEGYTAQEAKLIKEKLGQQK